ncbi:hypothetical protein [Burkholderia singularis]|uniref:Uncharacterized protein n=1 Tax=Burkholderia singularis TaxID=1503053 RepID=A0A238H0L8_9BURK|nr:hypothetical protein [Burkholderia singularis]SMF98779.1 hypothetical protein BSIN_2065 [Burkholderia singularis]
MTESTGTTHGRLPTFDRYDPLAPMALRVHFDRQSVFNGLPSREGSYRFDACGEPLGMTRRVSHCCAKAFWKACGGIV